MTPDVQFSLAGCTGSMAHSGWLPDNARNTGVTQLNSGALSLL
ncbi:MAG: hypothetical protein ACRCYL_06550 [Kluyvera sp.]